MDAAGQLGGAYGHMGSWDVDGICAGRADSNGGMKGGEAYGEGCMRDMLLQEPVPGEKQDVPVQYI